MREAFDRIVADARAARPEARVEGVAAELDGDRALGFPPLNERLARRMLESLASWPLLQGYRGGPGVAPDALVETLMRFSYLVADFPEISELDVTPLLATPRGVVPWSRHEVATRYCFNDYDREIAIVAEVGEDPERRLIGVGRLIADPDHENVEYAVLVSDEFQGRGLGGILTDYCYEIAKHWKLKRVVAETSQSNERMLAVFRDRGFVLRPDPGGDVVEVEKGLPAAADLS